MDDGVGGVAAVVAAVVAVEAEDRHAVVVAVVVGVVVGVVVAAVALCLDHPSLPMRLLHRLHAANRAAEVEGGDLAAWWSVSRRGAAQQTQHKNP